MIQKAKSIRYIVQSVGSRCGEQWSLTRTPERQCSGLREGGRRKSAVWDDPDPDMLRRGSSQFDPNTPSTVLVEQVKKPGIQGRW